MTSTQKKKIRTAITLYCAQAVANEARIHYVQQRPFHYYDNIGVGYVVLDCSAFVGNVFHAAMISTATFIHDPLDEKYSGYGNTWTEEAYLRANGKRVSEVNGYLVGDLARCGQGEHAHTFVCNKAGSAKTSQWTSHGREAGPNYVTLGYRDDLVGVWRHPALL